MISDEQGREWLLQKFYDDGFEVIISYRFKGWYLNIQWLTTNLISLTRNEVEQIKGFAQCQYNMYYAKSVVSTI